ncbi:MAG: Crp/Fnr family transcriptional regulator [Actinomycetota bacterium]
MTEETRAGSFLSALAAAEQDKFRRLGRHRELRRGDTLFHEGDPSDFVALILRGNVKVSSVADSGVETLLATRGPGDIIGEMAAVDGELRSADVSALDTVQFRIIPARDFFRFLEEHPSATRALLALCTARLRDADRKRAEVRGLDVLRRLTRRLLELSQTHGRQTSAGIVLDIPLSQQELAEWIGASREAVAKALRILRQRGALATQRRALTILDPELLRRLVEPRDGRRD